MNHVLVLAGGLSHERDVSLRSGRRVAEALRGAGLEVVERDVDGSLLEELRANPPSVAVPMLHGDTGEDGALREVLALVDVPYVGSTPRACRAAFDKPIAKSIVARAGLRVPDSVCLPQETFRELGAAAVMESLLGRLGLPVMVKPARSGSALGCTVVRSAEELPGAMVQAFAYGSVALIETFVSGYEVAVGVVDDGSGPRALPAIGIRADGGVYDYTARYTAGATAFDTPATLTPPIARECARVALAAHESLDLRDVSRSDLIVDDEGTVWFLEVNVAPGFTETSLLPLAVEADQATLGEVMATLVRSAQMRR